MSRVYRINTGMRVCEKKYGKRSADRTRLFVYKKGFLQLFGPVGTGGAVPFIAIDIHGAAQFREKVLLFGGGRQFFPPVELIDNMG